MIFFGLLPQTAVDCRLSSPCLADPVHLQAARSSPARDKKARDAESLPSGCCFFVGISYFSFAEWPLWLDVTKCARWGKVEEMQHSGVT